MKKLTRLGTKTAILVTEDRLEILPPLRTYEVYYEDRHKLMSFVCEMASINVMFRSIYKAQNETQKM